MNSPIKVIRDGLRITQDDLGKLLGVTRQMIFYYEKGRYQPSYDSIKKLISLAKENNIKINIEDFFKN